jgi:hypothetical protein
MSEQSARAAEALGCPFLSVNGPVAGSFLAGLAYRVLAGFPKARLDLAIPMPRES